MTTLYDIDRFCNELTTQVSAIDELEPQPVSETSITQVRLYKKTLILSAIDSLAGLRFTKKDYRELNRHKTARFIRFVTEYGEWQHGRLISIPCLRDQLQLKNADHSKLYRELDERLGAHKEDAGRPLTIEHIDVEAGQLLAIASGENEERLILDNQHYARLYRYNNCIAHENGEHCGVMEAYQYAQPHYYSYLDERSADDSIRWHLSYPAEHFMMIFLCCIKNMRRYFIATRTNPYAVISGQDEHNRWW